MPRGETTSPLTRFQTPEEPLLDRLVGRNTARSTTLTSDDEMNQGVRRLTNSAPSGEKITYLMLFGIKYSDLLHRNNITDILEAAGVATLGPTANMGRRFAHHVNPKDSIGL